MPTLAPPAEPLPETRLRVSAVLTWPRLQPFAVEVADSAWKNSHRYDELASGSIYFLSRDPAVSTTLSPYGYVAGNPLNGTDPSGLIDKNLLSQAQINQLNHECSGWQNQSLCRQAAFCAEPTYGIFGPAPTGGDCRKIADIAANDYAVVQAGLDRAGPCANVELMGGYTATHTEAERDLAETKAAFNAAVDSLNWYNTENECKRDTASAATAGIAGAGAAGMVIGAGLASGEAMQAIEGVHVGAFMGAGGGILGSAFAVPGANACNS